MPIVGNLSEFPLPEVLLLIGQRTGRLRLLDVPEFGILEIDVSNGAVQVMRAGATLVNETQQMLEKLGVILQARTGMFDFQLIPVSLMANPQPLTIHDLAMRLVCHVDEQAALDRKTPIGDQCHQLIVYRPAIWMEPELEQFFYLARPLLSVAPPMMELASIMEMDLAVVHENLSKLRLLGIIALVDPARAQTEMEPQEFADKTNAYFRVAQMTDEIRKLSTRLPAV